MRPRHATSGFTLVELLLALAIAAIVLMPLTDMLYSATRSARDARTCLDVNAEAGFALDRIATRAASARQGPPPPGSVAGPATWLLPLSYAMVGTDLIETDSSAKPVRNSVIASGVRNFELFAPETGAGRPLLRIVLTMDNDDCDIASSSAAVVRSRTVRVGDNA